MELASNFLQFFHASPRQLQRLLGICVSVAELVLHGFLNLRPLQWTARDWWTDDKDNWDIVLPLSLAIYAAIRPWTDRQWLLRRVP